MTTDDLASSLAARIDAFRLGDPAGVLDEQALAEAAALWQQAATADGEVRLVVVHVLGWLYWSRYLALPHGHDQADLKRALALFDIIVRVDPDAVPSQARMLLTQDAADGGGPDSPLRQPAAPLDPASEADDPDALEQTIAQLTDAVQNTPAGHPDLAVYLNNLAIAMATRFEHAGNLSDLDRAVESCERAVTATSARHPSLAGRLSNLGGVLRVRFEHGGDPADLDRAVILGERAVGAAPSGHPHRAIVQNRLGIALRTRFEHGGNMADLDRAVDLGERAVSATPDGHPDRASRLSNLGGALLTRFGRTRKLADLDRAVDLGGQVVTATPTGHPDLPGRLTNLGAMLQTRFGYTGTLADLDRAVHAGEQAISAAATGHRQLATMLTNLGGALLTRFGHTRDPADIDQAVHCGEQAVSATAAGHPNLAIYLSNLGNAMLTRFEHSVDPADLRHALLMWERAAASPAGPPDIRLASARRWAGTVQAAGLAAALPMYTTAVVDLLPLLAWRGVAAADQRHRLQANAASLGPEAAASAIAAGDYGLAVQLADQGRGVLWSQLLDSRTDLTALHHAHPELASALAKCREHLDQYAARGSSHSVRRPCPDLLTRLVQPHNGARWGWRRAHELPR